jgi:hypothetical protein
VVLLLDDSAEAEATREPPVVSVESPVKVPSEPPPPSAEPNGQVCMCWARGRKGGMTCILVLA